MTSYIVAYPATPGATFDADYYMATHMPLVHATFDPHGMTGSRVLLADQPDAPFVAVTTLDFADDAAFAAATSSPGAGAVFADVANFTTITPTAMRARNA